MGRDQILLPSFSFLDMLANFPGNFVDVSLNSTETRAAPSMRGMTCEGGD